MSCQTHNKQQATIPIEKPFFFTPGERSYIFPKTVQFKERVLPVNLLRLQGSVFCPVEAAFHAVQQARQLALYKPVYPMADGKVLATTLFVQLVESFLLKVGLPAQSFGGHSFRRGGASWAYQVGVPVETIRQMGDSKSLAYMNYIHINNHTMIVQ